LARCDASGSAGRTGAALARRLRAEQAAGTVHLLSSGAAAPELDELCAATGLTYQALGRQANPCNLILPGADRIVVRSPAAAAPACLGDAERAAVSRFSSHAGAVVSVSSKDVALTAAAIGTSNGAPRYLQPTGSLPPEMTLLLVRLAHDVVCNLEEWSRLARGAGLSAPNVTEASPQAPEAAAGLLRVLHLRQWAGSEAAVCTLGRRGSVIADWLRERIYHVQLEM